MHLIRKKHVPEVTSEMKGLLKRVAFLCNEAGNTVYETRETRKILFMCDELVEEIEEYLDGDE